MIFIWIFKKNFGMRFRKMFKGLRRKRRRRKREVFADEDS